MYNLFQTVWHCSIHIFYFCFKLSCMKDREAKTATGFVSTLRDDDNKYFVSPHKPQYSVSPHKPQCFLFLQ